MAAKAVVTHDLHDRALCLSSFQTGFMDGDRCHGWQFVANGFRSQVLSVIEICKGSIPLGGLSGAKSSLLTDSYLVDSSLFVGNQPAGLTRIPGGVDRPYSRREFDHSRHQIKRITEATHAGFSTEEE